VSDLLLRKPPAAGPIGGGRGGPRARRARENLRREVGRPSWQLPVFRRAQATPGPRPPCTATALQPASSQRPARTRSTIAGCSPEIIGRVRSSARSFSGPSGPATAGVSSSWSKQRPVGLDRESGRRRRRGRALHCGRVLRRQAIITASATNEPMGSIARVSSPCGRGIDDQPAEHESGPWCSAPAA